MQFSKQKTRLIGILTLGVFFIGGAFLLSGKSSVQPELEDISAYGSADSTFTLNNFQRSESEGSRKVWDITATQGRYYAGKSAAELDNAQISLFRKTGDTVLLSSNQATIHFDGQSLRQADMAKNVKVVLNDQYTVTTEKATFSRDKGNLVAPGEILLESAQAHVKGDSLYIDTEKQTLSLRHVESVFYPIKKQRTKGNKKAATDE